MNQDNDFPDNYQEINTDDLLIEIPTEESNAYPEKVPFGYDPMGDVNLRGRAARGLSSGAAPWWILIIGWIIFGSPTIILIIAAIIELDFLLLIPAFIPMIFTLILWRGTKAKISSQKRKLK